MLKAQYPEYYVPSEPTITHFPSGKGASTGEYKKGDFILTRGHGFYSRLIKFGQTLAFRGENRQYAKWSHAALIVSDEGDLIEALGRRVQKTKLAHYTRSDYRLVSVEDMVASDDDREQVVKFAEWALRCKYGVLTILSIGFGLLTGCRLKFGFDGQMICSGLVARALERTEIIFDRSPSHIMPADLAKYFNVPPPQD